MYDNLNLYLDLDLKKYEDDAYLKEVHQIVQLAYQHKLSVFWNTSQKNEFSYFSDIDDNFRHSTANKLDIILENAKIIKANSDCYLFEICFSAENTTLNFITNEAVSIIESHKNNALISSSYYKNSFLLLIKSEVEFREISFEIIKNKEDLLNWIQLFEPRNFNLSSKHGENGKGNWHGESVLLCNKEQAQILLDTAIAGYKENTAITDYNEKSSVKNLYNFDKNYNTFIEFYYEGNNPQKQWHGFHIKPEEWEKRVPASIRKHFKKYKP